MFNWKPTTSAAENAIRKHSWNQRTQADSMKVMGVCIRVHYQNTMRKDKTSGDGLTGYQYKVIQEKCCVRTGSTLGVSAAQRKPRDSNIHRATGL